MSLDVLLRMCEVGNLDEVVKILESSEECMIDAADENGTTALQVAAANNHVT